MRINHKYHRNKHHKQKHLAKARRLESGQKNVYHYETSSKTLELSLEDARARREEYLAKRAISFESGNHRGWPNAPKWYRKIFEAKYRAGAKSAMRKEIENWDFNPPPRDANYDWR